jgi:hypothetical protein
VVTCTRQIGPLVIGMLLIQQEAGESVNALNENRCRTAGTVGEGGQKLAETLRVADCLQQSPQRRLRVVIVVAFGDRY